MPAPGCPHWLLHRDLVPAKKSRSDGNQPEKGGGVLSGELEVQGRPNLLASSCGAQVEKYQFLAGSQKFLFESFMHSESLIANGTNFQPD